jgi:hypothetical protein
MEKQKLIHWLVNVTGAVIVTQMQVPRYKVKAVRVSTKNNVKILIPIGTPGPR